MLSKKERQIVMEVSRRWTGPNTWGWMNGYRIGLKEAILKPQFG